MKHFCLLIVSSLWLLPFQPLQGQDYGTRGFGTPEKALSAQAFAPGTPFPLGDAVFIVPDPVENKDIHSAVWFLDTRDILVSFTRLESYEEPILSTCTDVDGDGILDIVILLKQGSVSPTTVRIIYADEDSASGCRISETLLPKDPPRSVGASDLNGDGLADILVLYLNNYIIVLWQDDKADSRAPSFSSSTTLASKLPSPWHHLVSNEFLFGDFNGDGREDFTVLGYLYLNRGDGEFDSLALPEKEKHPSPVLAADIDADGRTELLYVDEGTGLNSAGVLKALGYSTQRGLSEKMSIQPGVSEIGGYCVGDYDSDGLMDLAFLSRTNGALTLLSGTQESYSLSFGRPDTLFSDYSLKETRLLGPVDWRRDGKLDWLFWDSMEDSLYIKYFKGVSFLEKSAYTGLDREMAGHAAAVGDYNNDGCPDIFVVNGRGANALFENLQDGTFVDVAEAAGVALANDGISCAWGDYDNDGFADLFVAGLSLPDKLFHNNSDGTFADSSHILRFSRENRRATSVSWGDYNCDGWLDILIGNFEGPNWLLVNYAGRSFSDRSKEKGLIHADKCESAVFIDVNNDDRLDIVALNAEGPNRLLTGSAKGVFFDSTAYSGLNPDGDYKKLGQTQNWGDFNGDGYPDLYITRAQDNDMLFINNGRHSSKERFSLRFSGNIQGKYGRIACAIADFSADSWPDLLIARSSVFGLFNSISTDLLFFGPLGSGPGLEQREASFAEALGLKQNLDTSLPVPADFDLDGDLDLVFVNYLPDNPSDLFLGSSLPLGYMQNQTTFSKTVSVRLRRPDGKSLIGTRVLASFSGKTFLQTVSGGFGRIQTGPGIVYALGAAACADSMVVIWPQGRRQSLEGPVYPGMIEIAEDNRGPSLRAIELPGELALPSLDGTDSLFCSIEVDDTSPIAWLRLILINTDARRADTLEYSRVPCSGSFDLSFPPPGPGDSLAYYFEAADIYGYKTRLPSNSRQYYIIIGIIPGDVDGNGLINVVDAVRLVQIINQGNPPSEREFLAGDFNRDGILDITDVISILTMNPRIIDASLFLPSIY